MTVQNERSQGHTFSSVGRITEVVIPNCLVVGMTQYMQSQYIGLTEDEILWVEILFVVNEPNFCMIYVVVKCHSGIWRARADCLEAKIQVELSTACLR